jgi:hypothetical protein
MGPRRTLWWVSEVISNVTDCLQMDIIDQHEWTWKRRVVSMCVELFMLLLLRCCIRFGPLLPHTLIAYERKLRGKMAYVITSWKPTSLLRTDQAVLCTLVNRLYICGWLNLNYGLLIFYQHEPVKLYHVVFFDSGVICTSLTCFWTISIVTSDKIHYTTFCITRCFRLQVKLNA